MGAAVVQRWMQGVFRERAVELSIVRQRGVENCCHFSIAAESKVGSTGLCLYSRARLRVLSPGLGWAQPWGTSCH